MKRAEKILVLAAAIAALLAGCTTEPQEGDVINNYYQDTVGIVPSDSIRYREIRLDAFSHFWQTRKLLATSVNAGIVVQVQMDAMYDTVIVTDSLILEDLALDKTADLPQHVFAEMSSFYGPFSRILYKASHEPKTFSCYFYNRGKTVVWADSTDGHFLRTSQTVLDAGETIQVDRAWHGVEDDIGETMEPVRCGYVPGQGFYLGDRYSDDYGNGPHWAGGEIVIRY